MDSMEAFDRRTIKEALEEGRAISDLVEKLKQEIRREPFSESAHRLLGDLYLQELEHESYAVTEYRKLVKIQDDVGPEDRFRLLLGYFRRGFHEKAYQLLKEMESGQFPDEIKFFSGAVDITEQLEEIRSSLSDLEQDQSEQWFRKHRDEGQDYLDLGNHFQAQREFEQALEYQDDVDVRCALARCLLTRRNYPRAVTNLKRILSESPHHEQALELLERAYGRLGIDFERSPSVLTPGKNRKQAG